MISNNYFGVEEDIWHKWSDIVLSCYLHETKQRFFADNLTVQ